MRDWRKPPSYHQVMNCVIGNVFPSDEMVLRKPIGTIRSKRKKSMFNRVMNLNIGRTKPVPKKAYAYLYDIHFTQDSIANKFKNGIPLSSYQSFLNLAKEGGFLKNRSLSLDVVRRNGRLYCTNNRTLFCLKNSRFSGSKVPCRIVEYDPRIHKRFFTSYNKGSFIRIRRNKGKMLKKKFYRHHRW